MTAGDLLVDQLLRFKPETLSASAWAERAGVARTIWSDMRRHGNPSRRTLERLLGVAGASIAEFEALRVSTHHNFPKAGEDLTLQDRFWGWKGAPKPPLDVVACTEEGTFDIGGLAIWTIDPHRIAGRVPRPPSLDSDSAAFAITVVGLAMAPRFRMGRMIAISPGATVAPDEEVIVRLAHDGDETAYRAIPGQLRGINAAVVMIHQPGPGLTASIPRDRIHSVAVIAGELF